MKSKLMFLSVFVCCIAATLLCKKYLPTLTFVAPVIFGMYVMRKYVTAQVIEKVVRIIMNR
jgi:hypothetical protein